VDGGGGGDRCGPPLGDEGILQERDAMEWRAYSCTNGGDSSGPPLTRQYSSRNTPIPTTTITTTTTTTSPDATWWPLLTNDAPSAEKRTWGDFFVFLEAKIPQKRRSETVKVGGGDGWAGVVVVLLGGTSW